jgi:hypothetical protein
MKQYSSTARGFSKSRRNQISRIFVVCLVVVGAFLGLPQAFAQTSFGSIVGTVRDSSNATVVGAQVTLKNNGTGQTETATTGSAGNYTFLNLNPGSYSVVVSNPGFKEFNLSQVDVTVGGTTRADATLSLGDVSQSVTVEASASNSLQTDSSSLGGVVEGRQVLESPLNGRNVNNLLDFVPGVVPGGGTSGNTVANGGSGSFQAGAQTQAIAYGNYQIGGGFSGQSTLWCPRRMRCRSFAFQQIT